MLCRLKTKTPRSVRCEAAGSAVLSALLPVILLAVVLFAVLTVLFLVVLIAEAHGIPSLCCFRG